MCLPLAMGNNFIKKVSFLHLIMFARLEQLPVPKSYIFQYTGIFVLGCRKLFPGSMIICKALLY